MVLAEYIFWTSAFVGEGIEDHRTPFDRVID